MGEQPSSLPRAFPRASTWHGAVPRGQRSVFWGCFAAIALDAMDLRAFSSIVPAIAASWRLGHAQVGLLGAASLGAATVGGWTAGLLGDRLGRTRVMQASLLLCSLSTVLAGFATSYEELLACRVAQGFGFGGQIAGGSVVVAELVRPEYRGRTVSWAQSGVAIGWCLAALLSAASLAWLAPDLGWRAVCWSAIVPAALSLVLHRFVRDSAAAMRARRRATAEGLRSSVKAILCRGGLRSTLPSCLLALGVQGNSLVLLVWLPTYLAGVRHVSTAGACGHVAVLAAGAFCGYLAGGQLSDRIGRRPKFLFFAAGGAVVLATYLSAPLGEAGVLLLGVPLGFFSQGSLSSLGVVFAELYPTHLRATGTSFAYGAGRLGAAAWVSLVGLCAPVVSLEGAICAACLCCHGLIVAAVLLLRETRGVNLPG